MFSSIEVKRENEDNNRDQIDCRFYKFDNKYKSEIKQINSPNVSSTTEPPKKLLKTEVEVISTFDSVKSEIFQTKSNIDHDNVNLFNAKYLTKNLDKCNTKPIKGLTYDAILQELFSWNPEWLQGRAMNKPPLKKFEKQLIENSFRIDYSRDEYISRHLPYIQSEIFIKLSDSFKNEAPARRQHQMFINDCYNSGDLGLNKLLVCYMIRDIRQNFKPIARVNDVIIITLEVMQPNSQNSITTKKQYFGLITGHSMIDLTELESKILEKFRPNLLSDLNAKTYLFWDKFLILSKRSRESSIIMKQMSRMEVVINASLELKQIENLLYDNWKCSKLLSSIFSANANIHQFSAQELNDCPTVRKTLSQNAIEMINKSNPMVYYKGVSNLMVVDISDNSQRVNYLCDIIVESIESFCRNNVKIRFLVITKTEELSVCWRKRLRNVCGIKSAVKVWSLDSGRGWSRHEEVRRFTKTNAKRIHDCCGEKLRHLKETENESYLNMIEKKDVYQKLIQSCNFTNNSKEFLIAAIHIAKEELNLKGFKNLLNECNVIIATFDNLINFQLLIKDSIKPFDCCIVDDSHTLPEVSIFSSMHFGIQCMIIGGDSEGSAVCVNPLAVNHLFDKSLFNRIFQKCVNSM